VSKADPKKIYELVARSADAGPVKIPSVKMPRGHLPPRVQLELPHTSAAPTIAPPSHTATSMAGVWPGTVTLDSMRPKPAPAPTKKGKKR
jgi:hypothetical protein